MSEVSEDSTVQVIVLVESPPLKISVVKKCPLTEVSKNIALILDELQKSEKKLPKWAKVTVTTSPSVPQPLPAMPASEEPFEKLANRLDVDAAQLIGAKLFGIKDNKVQIFKTQKFAPAECVMAICYVSEIGVGKSALSYEELKEAFLGSHVKSKSPLYMIITNIANAGYIEKQRYDSQKEIVLTSKGENKIKEDIQKVLTS